ncbi:Condensin complex subunit 1 [Bienertia sinuspersici]
MGNHDNGRWIFPLTSLQIGDLQSYLSHLNIFLAAESNTFYILVDNRPWIEGLGSRRAQLWQLMVTKSRLSPFANSRARKGRNIGKEKSEKKDSNKVPNFTKCTKSSNSKFSERWFSLIDAATLSQKRGLQPVNKLKYSLQLNRELHSTLFGLIIFEVSWDDVRGINYSNELQTDTSLALETKFMRRWEFDSIVQAVGCISSWFSGTDHEQNILRDYLLSTVDEVFYDANEDFSEEETSDVELENASSYGLPVGFNVPPTELDDTSILHTPPPPNVPYKRRKVTRSWSSGVEVDTYCEETPKTPNRTFDPFGYCESTIEATEYKDVLILFRFNDRDLPFKLKDIIMYNLRLLTLLEYGLPSWVIFLQSYPVFCHLYRPWMCPLVRALYVIISVTTVVIGFYDLYKNVPLLKATASHLFGPIFDWIETWEMVSRVKYLGTMLFLHNFEKAVKWILMITRTMRSFFSVLARPVIEPLVDLSKFFLPFWTVCAQMSESFFTFIGIVLGSSSSFVGNVVEIVLLPIWLMMSFIWTSAMFIVLPVFWAFWEILYAPVRMVLALFSGIAFVSTLVYEMLGELWSSACSIVQIASATEATVSTTYEVSMWRSLWNDLFSKVFRAVKSILNGLVAFFSACNRHRLSIYNHLKEFLRKLSHRRCRPQHVNLQHRKKHVDPHRQAQQIHRTQKLMEANNRGPRHVER